MTIDKNILLHKIHECSHDEAINLAVAYINENMNAKKPNIKRLIYDVETSKSSKEISGILWRTKLANEGLRVSNSSWKKHYDQL
jgi:hypothetical protein